MNNGANILTQLICYFSIEVYTTVISSSMSIISYKTEILQLFSDNLYNFSPRRLYAFYIFEVNENM